MNLKELRRGYREFPTEMQAIEKSKKLVKSSGYFHRAWYLARNPDVYSAGLDPLDHFCRHGDRELRLPGPFFDSRAYVATWSDVTTSGMGPLEHFLVIGREAGRKAPLAEPHIRGIISHLLIGHARLQMAKGNMIHALRISSVASFCFKSLDVLVLRSDILGILGHRFAAFKAIEGAAQMPAGANSVDVMRLYGSCAAQIGRLKLAIEKFERVRSLRPDDEVARYCLGSLYAVSGRLPEADAIFAQDIPVTCGNGAQTGTGVLSFSSAAGHKDDDRLTRRTLVLAIKPPKSPSEGWRAIYFGAADSVYFCRYARHVLNSLRRNAGPGILAHFHVVNPDAEAECVIESLQTLGANLAVSTETIALERLSAESRRTLYSCARYLVAPEILREYRAPLIIADTDQLVMSRLDPFIAANEGAEVGLMRFEHQMANIFSLYSATLLIVFPTAFGEAFTVRLAKNIESVVDKSEVLTWHLDQAMLAVTQMSSPDIRFSFFSPSFVNLGHGKTCSKSHPTDTSIFWSITNSMEANESKLSTPAFTQFD